MKSKSFFIKSLGCKTNQIEGQLIAQDLVENGFEPCDNFACCDFYILNSCSVTEHADNQAIYLIKQFRGQNKTGKVVLTGCFAQTSSSISRLDADIILGNNEKLSIVKYINKSLNCSDKIIAVDNIFNVNKFKQKNIHSLNTTRPSIKIQEGCSNRCSYCIIPYARGNSRSDSIENIINQINFLSENNYKEVVLTGTHIGEWGREFNQILLDLLIEIEQTKILRYRLGSLYVTEINDDLIEFLSKSNKFCAHFHLSLQSLCDKTLKNMNRFYTKEFALEVINKLHSNFELPFLGCDIITGFPGENEEDFEETYNALYEAKLSYIHSFPYSKRKGTRAFDMKNQVFEHIKKERTKKLINLSNELHKKFLLKNKNTLQEVLFQRKTAKNGKYLGITRNYIKVYKQSAENLWNTVQTLNLNEYEIE